MRLLRGITRTGFVLLTAIGTLAAGSPHFDCLCPNGSRKPFCLGFSLTGRDCCGVSCCATADDEGNSPTQTPNAEPACPFCSKHETPSHDAPRKPVEAKQTGCQKTWQAGEYAPARGGPEKSADLAVVFVSAPPAGLALATVTPEAPFRLQFKCDASPPTDLVVAFQRFNI